MIKFFKVSAKTGLGIDLLLKDLEKESSNGVVKEKKVINLDN